MSGADDEIYPPPVCVVCSEISSPEELPASLDYASLSRRCFIAFCFGFLLGASEIPFPVWGI